ncbi:MAG: metallophosphoesterase [Polyangiaceae bacterium]
MLKRGLIALFCFTVGCGSSDSTSDKGSGGGGSGGAGGSSCAACDATNACDTGSVCTILTGESFCLKPCPKGNECASNEACLTQSNLSGEGVSVCVPEAECKPAGSGGSGGGSAGTGGGAGTGAGGASGGAGGATGGSGGVAGGGSGGTAGIGGGSAAPLVFAAVGDTRGALPFKAGYPTDIITQIYTTIEALTPKPTFAVSTGDYAFTIVGDTSDQLDLYLGARQKFSGEFYPAMGNHECTWLTNSNCGPGTADGMTAQYKAFLSKILNPTGQTSPNYTKNVAAPDSSWTAKFVFVAPNAWTDAQSTWLEAELSKPTTYTFVLRHEPSDATSAPGVTPSDAILAKHPYTLMIVGHTHTYSRTNKQVMFGNGGAPLSGGKGYGFGLFTRRPDGTILVEARDYKTGAPDASFSFAVNPDGSPAP